MARARAWFVLGTFLVLLAFTFHGNCQDDVTIGVCFPLQSTSEYVSRLGVSIRDAVYVAFDASSIRPLGGPLATRNISVVEFTTPDLTLLPNATLEADFFDELLTTNMSMLAFQIVELEDFYSLLSSYPGQESLPLVSPLSQGNMPFDNPETFARNVFQLRPTVDDEIANLINFASQELLASRYIMLSDDPQLFASFSSILGSFGTTPLLTIQIDPREPLDLGLLGPIIAAEPQVVVISTLPGLGAGVMAALKAFLPESTTYLYTSISAFAITDDIVDFAANFSLSLEYASSNVYVSSVLPPVDEILGDTSPGSLGSLYLEDLASLNRTLDVPVDPLAFEAYAYSRWMIRVLSSLEGEVSHQTILDTIYSSSTNVIGGTRYGPYLDDCSATGTIFTCCNVGQHRLFISSLEPVSENATTAVLVEDYVFQWDTCAASSDNVNAPLVFGQSVGTLLQQNASVSMGLDIQRGILASFGAQNERDRFNGRKLVLFSLEDGGDAETLLSNSVDLDSTTPVLGFVGYDNADAVHSQLLPYVLGNNETKAIVGTIGANAPLWNDYASPVVNIFPSTAAQIGASVEYFAKKGLGGVKLVIPESYAETFAIDVFENALKVNGLASSGITYYSEDGAEAPAVPSQVSVGDGVVFVTTSTDHSLEWMGGASADAFELVVVGEMVPTHALEQLAATSDAQTRRRRRQGRGGAAGACSSPSFSCIAFTKGLPPPTNASAQSSALVQSYFEAMGQLQTGDNATSYPSLEGFVLGEFLGDVIGSINGDVTPEKFLSSVYSTGQFRVYEEIFGLFDDACTADGGVETRECCNQGSTTVYVVGIPASSSTGQVDAVDSISIGACDITFRARSGGNEDDVDVGVVVGVSSSVVVVLVSCLAGCFAIVLCCVVVAFVALFSGYVRYAQKRMLANGDELLAPLVEPNYREVAFPSMGLINMVEVDNELLKVIPGFHSTKTIERRVLEFERLVMDEAFLVPLTRALRAAADNVTELCNDLMNVYHYNDQGLHMLSVFAQVELGPRVLSADTSDVGLIFRDDNLVVRMYRRFCVLVGLPYLWHALAAPLHEMRKAAHRSRDEPRASDEAHGYGSMNTDESLSFSMESIELDPRRRNNPTKSSQLMSVFRLKLTAQKMFQNLMSADFPPELRGFLHTLVGLLEEKADFTEEEFATTKRGLLSACVFLRFISVALTAPQLFGLMPEPPSTRTLRVCILLSKVLQNLASGTCFSEDYMADMNDFVEVNTDDMYSWLCSLPVEYGFDVGGGGGGAMSPRPVRAANSGKYALVRGSSGSGIHQRSASSLAMVTENSMIVPPDVYQRALKGLFALALRERETFVHLFESHLSVGEFKVVCMDYLEPLGFFEEADGGMGKGQRAGRGVFGTTSGGSKKTRLKGKRRKGAKLLRLRTTSSLNVRSEYSSPPSGIAEGKAAAISAEGVAHPSGLRMGRHAGDPLLSTSDDDSETSSSGGGGGGTSASSSSSSSSSDESTSSSSSSASDDDASDDGGAHMNDPPPNYSSFSTSSESTSSLSSEESV